MADATERQGVTPNDLTDADVTIKHMLSTADNPYNPFTQWDEWFIFDMSKGYATPGLLARIANSSDEMSDPDIDIALEQAIIDIVRENVSGMYIRVAQPD